MRLATLLSKLIALGFLIGGGCVGPDWAAPRSDLPSLMMGDGATGERTLASAPGPSMNASTPPERQFGVLNERLRVLEDRLRQISGPPDEAFPDSAHDLVDRGSPFFSFEAARTKEEEGGDSALGRGRMLFSAADLPVGEGVRSNAAAARRKASPQNAEVVEFKVESRGGDEDWRRLLNDVRGALLEEIAAAGDDFARKARLETRLRILDLAAEKRGRCPEAIEHGDPSQRRYWSSLLQSMAISLCEDDDAGLPGDAASRSAMAMEHLREAERHLAASSNLQLKNLRCCREVASFGSTTGFSRNEFRPNQEVLLYVEVDNIAADERDGKFETELQGSYEVFDEQGLRVASRMLPLDKQAASFYRRDYFIAYRAYIPSRIGSGKYSLVLSIEDRKGNNFGHASVEFRVKT